jgi:hypothetical protein
MTDLERLELVLHRLKAKRRFSGDAYVFLVQLLTEVMDENRSVSSDNRENAAK